MKSETNRKLREKLNQILLSLICFAAYIFVFIAALANTFNTGLDHFILG